MLCIKPEDHVHLCLAANMCGQPLNKIQDTSKYGSHYFSQITLVTPLNLIPSLYIVS